jgi:hypothetical protein
MAQRGRKRYNTRSKEHPMSVAPSIYEQAHKQAIRASVQEAAASLQELLSRRVTAFIVGVGDGKTVTRWASGEITDIRDEEVEKRLRRAYEIAQLLLQFDSPATVRAWFIGLNPQLGDISPAEAIHQGKLQEALIAARAFIAGG